MENKSRAQLVLWLVIAFLAGQLSAWVITLGAGRVEAREDPGLFAPDPGPPPEMRWEHRCGAVHVAPLQPARLERELQAIGLEWELVSLVLIEDALLYCMKRLR